MTAPAPLALLVSARHHLGDKLAGLDFGQEVTTVKVADPRRKPRGLAETLAGLESRRLVLALPNGNYPLWELQTRFRQAGLDPLGVEIIHLPRESLDRCRVLLAGAVGRALAFTGSRIEHNKPILNPGLSGRALFKVNFEHYIAIPALDNAQCVADRGCKACVKVCPHEALRHESGRVTLDRAHCTACGLCLTACPTGALANPAFTPAQLEAQVRAMTAAAQGPIGLIYTCGHRDPPGMTPDWYPVELPCVAMAPASWLLAPLLLGAGAVAVQPCAAGCGPAAKQLIVRLDFALRYLNECGAKLVRLGFWPMTRLKPPPPCPGISVKELFDPQKPATTLGAVALSLGAGPVTLNHPGAPLGLIQIDAAACTLCGRCSQLCPTGALAQAESVEGRAELTFNPRACPACRLCLPVCPELSRKAIALRWAVDLQALAVGRATLHQSHTLACLSCGADMGSEDLLERVAGKVAEVDPRLSRMVRSYCSACRAGPAGQGLLTGQETPP